MRFGCAVLVGMMLAAVPKQVLGDDETKRDPVTAEALFAEGRRLMASGNYEAACPKFADSETLDPAPGTALNLATCYEKAGKLASAWAAFRSAQTLAWRLGQADRARAATKEIAALEPRLSRLTISVPPASQVPGLEVRCDDRVVLRSEWGLALPRDGGAYEIAATAPGKKSWRARVELRESGDQRTVDVPVLEDSPPRFAPPGASVVSPARRPAAETVPSTASPSVPLAAPDAIAQPRHTQRTIAIAVGATGGVTMAVAGVLVIMAKSRFDTASNENAPARGNDSASAVHLADAATVVFGIGAAAAAAGGVLWLISPAGDARVGTGVGTRLGTNGRELLFTGAFR